MKLALTLTLVLPRLTNLYSERGWRQFPQAAFPTLLWCEPLSPRSGLLSMLWLFPQWQQSLSPSHLCFSEYVPLSPHGWWVKALGGVGEAPSQKGSGSSQLTLPCPLPTFCSLFTNSYRSVGHKRKSCLSLVLNFPMAPAAWFENVPLKWTSSPTCSWETEVPVGFC